MNVNQAWMDFPSQRVISLLNGRHLNTLSTVKAKIIPVSQTSECLTQKNLVVEMKFGRVYNVPGGKVFYPKPRSSVQSIKTTHSAL